MTKGKESQDKFVHAVEWHMMDPKKFIPLSMGGSFASRACLYPSIVIKTRLQIQQGKAVYRGTYDAFRQIVKHEGVKGLYKGFWVNSFSVLTAVVYLTTYENLRNLLHKQGIDDVRLKGFIAGGLASFVGQILILPLDVVSQHLMMAGQIQPGTNKIIPNFLPSSHQRVSDWKATMWIAQRVYEKDGWRGFYRGNIAALSAAVPGGALWWFIYHVYQENLLWACPSWVPHLSIQCTSAILSGATTTTLLNPLDIIRARMQIQRLGSVTRTFRDLWHEEKMFMFTKGLSARLIQVAVFSFLDILGYETIKRLSVQPEYANKIKW